MTDAELVALVDRIGQNAAARELGIARTTFQGRYQRAMMRQSGGAQPAQIAETYRPAAPDIGPKEAPKYRVIHPPSRTLLRVLAIGDSHDHPGLPDKSRFALLGKFAAAERFDVIVHIGDFLDLHSLCSHTREETYRGKAKPSFEQDLASGWEALAAFEAELPADYRPRKHVTLGNHEARAWAYEDRNPASVNMLTGPLTGMFEQHGWTWQRFGHWTLLGGVAFTHVPRSVMARPLGGKQVENTVANESVRCTVFGHTHRYNHILRAKHGYNEAITVTNLGTSMPEDYLPDYAEGLPTGYSYGAVELEIHDGRVHMAAHRSWRSLEHRFGKRAA